MRVLKKLLIAAFALLACISLVVLILIAFAYDWEKAVKPLSVQELEGLTATVADVENDQDRDATIADDVGEFAPADSSAPPQALLASRPTGEQLLQKFDKFIGSERMKFRGELLVQRVVVSGVDMVTQETPWISGHLHGEVGRWSLHLGDFDAARSHLREAVRVEKDESWRKTLGALLAWVEEDPKVATVLLEQSCSGQPYAAMPEVWAPLNALELAVMTGSDELADYYFQRFRYSWQDWLNEGYTSVFPEVLAWIEERLSKKAA